MKYRHRIEIPAAIILEVETDSNRRPSASEVMEALEPELDSEDGITIQTSATDRQLRIYPSWHPTKPHQPRHIVRLHFSTVQEQETANVRC
jgi:hypothetical protein